MRQLISLMSVTLVVAITACDRSRPQEAIVAEVLQPEVSAFLESYLSAIEARDTARLRTFYVDDGRFVWFEDGNLKYRSADEIIAALAALPADTSIRTDVSDTRVVRLGRTGADASTKFRTVIGDSVSGFQFSGVISFALEKGSDGWRIVSGHTSSTRSASLRTRNERALALRPDAEQGAARVP